MFADRQDCLLTLLAAWTLLFPSGATPAAEILRKASEIQALTLEEADEGREVRLRGVVTFTWQTATTEFTLQDETGAVKTICVAHICVAHICVAHFCNMNEDPVMNPFVFGKVVEEADFCPRESLAAELAACIESGQNTVVFGRRRVGKSSLVLHTCKRFPKRLILLIDLFFTKDSGMFLDYCSDALFSFNAQRKGMVEKMLEALRRIRPRVEMDPGTGNPSLSLQVSNQEPALILQTVDDFFGFLGAEFPARELIVCFDEFQSILHYPDASQLLAKIRGKVQYHKFPYIFTGSDRSGIRQIFIDPKSPFYKSVRPLEVGGLRREEFQPFLAEKFAGGNRKVSENVWHELFALDVPGDIQQLCASIWDCSSKRSTIDGATLNKAYERLFAYEIEGFRAQLANLTALQIRVLKHIAAHGTGDLYSVATQSLIGASGSSIRRSLSALIKKWILVQDRDQIFFNNPFLQRFIQRGNV